MGTPLGDKIHALRKKKGYTLEKLAELAGSSKSYIWELENRNPPRPSAEKITAIAKQLDVTPEFLIDESESKPGDDVVDAAFFRRYRKLDQPVKERIREIMEVLAKETKK